MLSVVVVVVVKELGKFVVTQGVLVGALDVLVGALDVLV